MPIRGRTIAAGACLFGAGVACLVDEIVWIRQASLVFGAGTPAVGTVVGVVFAGLALGAELFGRWAARWGRPLLAVAILEGVLALWVPATPWMFARALEQLAPLQQALGDAPGALALARLLLVAAIVLPPAVLMGGTLPLFCRRFVDDDARVGASVGVLYATNTLGAAVGCLAAGFVLLPALGITRTLALAAAVHLATALGALALRDDGASRASAGSPRVSTGGVVTPVFPAGDTARIVPVLFFLVGLIALGHEVLWTRVLALVVRHSTHVWSLALGSVLVGIVLGSLLAATRADRSPRRALLFGALQIAGALVVLAVMLLPPASWRALGPVSVVLLLGPAILSGASFPLAVRLVVRDARHASLGAGRLAALNAIGGLLGATLVGFVGVPHLGLQASLFVLSALGMLTGALAWLRLDAAPRAPRVLALVPCVLLWSLLPRWMGTRLPQDHLVDPGETLVDHAEGLLGQLAVLRRDGVTSLEIDRWWQGEDRVNHQAVAAVVPWLLHPDPRSALVVGVGTGQTPATLLTLGIESLHAVDVEPAIFGVIREHFDGRWLDDPRVTVRTDDGRHDLLHARARYDLVSLELGQVFVPSVAACYTLEFYERVRVALRPEGVVCQFVPAAFLGADALRRVVATFRAVFPACLLVYNTSELLLVGSPSGVPTLHPERLALLARDGPVRELLDHAYWGGAAERLNRVEVLVGGLLAGPGELAAIAADAPVLRDDRPWLEYVAARVPGDAALERPLVALLRAHRADVGTWVGRPLSATERATAQAVADANLGDMLASATLRGADAPSARGDDVALLALAEQALAENPRSVRALALRGQALLALGRLDEAWTALETAAAERPDDPAIRRALAFALHRRGALADAVPHYEAALRLRADDAELHNNLGAILAQLGHLAEARARFAEAVRLRPDWADARTNLEQAERVLDAR